MIIDDIDIQTFYFGTTVLPLAKEGAIPEVPTEYSCAVSCGENMLATGKHTQHGNSFRLGRRAGTVGRGRGLKAQETRGASRFGSVRVP